VDWATVGAIAGAIAALIGAAGAVTGVAQKGWHAFRRRRAARRRHGVEIRHRVGAPRPTPLFQRGARAPLYISFRAEETAATADRLRDELRAELGEGWPVRMTTEPPDLSPDERADAVAAAGALLVLIGPHWLSSEDASGQRRLRDPLDPVHVEVAAGLGAGVTTVPVFVRGGAMPFESELPDDLAGISRRQGLEISDERWEHDVQRAVNALRRIIGRPRDGARTAWDPSNREM
jgi:hypothetical protein